MRPIHEGGRGFEPIPDVDRAPEDHRVVPGDIYDHLRRHDGGLEAAISKDGRDCLGDATRCSVLGRRADKNLHGEPPVRSRA